MFQTTNQIGMMNFPIDGTIKVMFQSPPNSQFSEARNLLYGLSRPQGNHRPAFADLSTY